MLTEIALSVAARGFPVFPTRKKIPVWGNEALGLKSGEGGFKIATTDPGKIRKLFDHPAAQEVSVPTGTKSGLLCVDVDSYKGGSTGEWVREHHHLLKDSRIHATPRGGTHYIFKCPPGLDFPATATEGVDIKGEGGYICWAGAGGYICVSDVPPPEIPADLIKLLQSQTGKAPTNSPTGAAAIDSLEHDIKSATTLYPTLRTLALTLANFNVPFNEIVAYLRQIMRDSAASDPGHPRHNDWLDRYPKIPQLTLTAIRKCKTQGRDSSGDCPADEPEKPSSRHKLTPIKISSLECLTTTPIEWLVPDLLPRASTFGLAGASGVGKTRWLTALAVCTATGYFDFIGFPNVPHQQPVLWIANEERTDDLKRRINAFATYHNLSAIGNISLAGKEFGGIKIASSKFQKTQLETDRLNEISKYIIENNCKLLILDPYVSLSAGVSENSAESVSMLRDAFNHITQQTNCSVIFAHHTPKRESSKKPNWYNGMETAFRGSSDIFAQLDVAFTLAPWFPNPENEAEYNQWVQEYEDLNLSRFITLSMIKLREGKRPPPLIFEICSQLIENQENIGFCKLSKQECALDALDQKNKKNLRKFSVCSTLINSLGPGIHKNTTEIYNTIKHLPIVPEATFRSNGSVRIRTQLERFFQDFQEPTQVGKHLVEFQYSQNERTWGVSISLL